jgi:hypothetical protein
MEFVDLAFKRPISMSRFGVLVFYPVTSVAIVRRLRSAWYAMRTSGVLVSRSFTAKSAFRGLFETFGKPIAAGAPRPDKPI